MTSWDGTGLPPGAVARLERAKRDGVVTSLLKVGGQIGLDVTGFRPVGEAMGCIVEHIGFQGYGGCGYYPYGLNPGYGRSFNNPYHAMGTPPPTVTASQAQGFVGFAPYVNALHAGWDGAIGRMLTEAASLGADGVIDVRLQRKNLGEQNYEFLALGTAVASTGTTHLTTPFATTLSGADFAKLVTSGWIPAAILVAISVAIRHDDYQTIAATQAFAGNIEVPGYTELAHHVRADVRRGFEKRAKAVGADGAIVSYPMTLSMHGLEVSEGHRDHVAEATLFGTAIARFSESPVATSPLMVLSLRK